MSALSDALSALKNVVLMQERLDVMRSDLSRTADDVRGLNDYVSSVDKRVIRIETMIEMTGRAGSQSRIEEQ
jgi:hypothetical protein